MLVDVMFNRPLASWFWSSEKIWAEDLESYIAETLVPRGWGEKRQHWYLRLRSTEGNYATERDHVLKMSTLCPLPRN